MATTIVIEDTFDAEVVDELHLFLVDYVKMLSRKLKVLKKEVEQTPEAEGELKKQMRQLRLFRRHAEDVLEDLEFGFQNNLGDTGSESE